MCRSSMTQLQPARRQQSQYSRCSTIPEASRFGPQDSHYHFPPLHQPDREKKGETPLPEREQAENWKRIPKSVKRFRKRCASKQTVRAPILIRQIETRS